jgi:hypothetical protein
VGKKAFALGLELKLEKIDIMKKPPDIDILFELSHENWLAMCSVVHLVLRRVEVGKLLVAIIWVQDD